MSRGILVAAIFCSFLKNVRSGYTGTTTASMGYGVYSSTLRAAATDKSVHVDIYGKRVATTATNIQRYGGMPLRCLAIE